MAALGGIWDLGFPYTLIPIKDQSMAPVVEAQSLKPWTTREAPSPLLKLMVVQQLVVIWVFSWEVSSRFCCSAILLQTTWESSAKNDPDVEHLQPNLSSAGGGEYVLLVWWGMKEVLNQTISAGSFNAIYLCISLCSSCIFSCVLILISLNENCLIRNHILHFLVSWVIPNLVLGVWDFNNYLWLQELIIQPPLLLTYLWTTFLQMCWWS